MDKNRESDLWLAQFKSNDLQWATKMLRALQFVTAADFSSDITYLLSSKLPKGERAALFVERELRNTRARLPIRMYKEAVSSMGRGTPKRFRATGAALPAVSSSRSDRQSIGSEGIVAALLTKLASGQSSRFLVQPSAEEIRRKKVRHIVVITDLIGSGCRIGRFLTSMWQVRSVRSWNSFHLVKFWVFAYSATEKGRASLSKHRTRPILETVSACPTIFNMFAEDEISEIRGCCERNSPDKNYPLGFENTGALIAFAHGCPNNVPAIFWINSDTMRSPWMALFPARGAQGVSDAIEQSRSDTWLLALDTLNSSSVSRKSAFIRSSRGQKQVIVLLAAIRNGHRYANSLSAVTGMRLWEIADAERTARNQGLLDVKGRLTEPGFALLRKLRNSSAKSARMLLPTVGSRYYPKVLRAPQ